MQPAVADTAHYHVATPAGQVGHHVNGQNLQSFHVHGTDNLLSASGSSRNNRIPVALPDVKDDPNAT